MAFDQQPVVRVSVKDPHDAWPFTIPAVAQVAREGLDLPPGVTFLVGENGSGKSTLVEAIAMAYGLSPEGGTPYGHVSTHASESGLHNHLSLQRGISTGRWGFFLRSETMHNWYTYKSHHPGGADPEYHHMSHGESFLAVLERNFDAGGLYCLDEPEAALSFRSSLTLMRVLADVAESGGQVLCATHSPVIAALPGAHILEVGQWGLRPSAWEDLELVQHHRAYLDQPMRYLRHTLA